MKKSFVKIALLAFLVMLLSSAVVFYPAIGLPLTTIYVDPDASTVHVGQTFTINIKISDVTDLYGWEFKLGWTPTLLDAVDVFEEDFLKSEGETYFIKEINNTEGYVHAACSLLGEIPGVHGDGTLASVKFYAEAQGESVLDLYDTKLGNSFEQPITHTANDGNVTISKSVGGISIPVDKLVLLAPWIGTGLTVIFALIMIVVFTKYRKKKNKLPVSHVNAA